MLHTTMCCENITVTHVQELLSLKFSNLNQTLSAKASLPAHSEWNNLNSTGSICRLLLLWHYDTVFLLLYGKSSMTNTPASTDLCTGLHWFTVSCTVWWCSIEKNPLLCISLSRFGAFGERGASWSEEGQRGFLGGGSHIIVWGFQQFTR